MCASAGRAFQLEETGQNLHMLEGQRREEHGRVSHAREGPRAGQRGGESQVRGPMATL